MIACAVAAGCDGEAAKRASEEKQQADRAAATARAAAARKEAAAKECGDGPKSIAARAEKLISERKWFPAQNLVARCADLLDNPELKALERKYAVRSLIDDATSKNSPLSTQRVALERLQREYPEDFKPYAQRLASVIRKQEQAEIRERRSQGVTIGMSAERVLQSSWGKPEKVNRTTTAHGVREQWVYGGGNYLYFDDGVLTGIQN